MGSYKNDTYKAASVYDPATGDVAQMNIMIAPDTRFYEPEIIEQAITNGAYQSGWRYKVDLASSDWDAYSQLKTFFDEKTEVRAVAAGAGKGSKNLQWYESVRIAELRRVPKANRSEGDSHFIVSLIHEGGENAAIYTNVNLLQQANVNGVTVTGFVDGDADEIADGYIAHGTSPDFTDGVQKVTFSNVNTAGMYRNVVFPISSVQINLISSLRLQSGSTTVNSELELLNFANSSIDSIASSNVSAYTFQKKNISIATTSATYTLRAFIMRRTATGPTGADMYCQLPCLRTDAGSDYIAG